MAFTPIGEAMQGLPISQRVNQQSITRSQELVRYEDGNYIVRATISKDGQIVCSAHGCDRSLEVAEDRAIARLQVHETKK